MRNSKSILKFKTLREAPVVAVTAYTDPATAKRAKEVGMATVLHKPVG
jgi:CheY-like chemotaxis protein